MSGCFPFFVYFIILKQRTNCIISANNIKYMTKQPNFKLKLKSNGANNNNINITFCPSLKHTELLKCHEKTQQLTHVF